MLFKSRAFIVGLCDSVVVIAYILGINPIIIQAAALAVKLVLLFQSGDFERSLLAKRWVAWAALVIPPVVSLIFAQGNTLMPLVQALGFAFSMATTLLLLRIEQVGGYLRGVAWTISMSSVVFIAMALTGRLSVVWGRTYYFHDAQPNLGAELAVAASVAAALSMRRPYAFIALNLFASWLLEGRSAIIAIVFLLLIMGARLLWNSARTRGVAHVFALPVFIGAILATLPTVLDAMRIHDQHRGEVAGFGRLGRWSNALETFQNHPFTGLGYGMHSALGLRSPHNFFFYGLAELGILSTFTFATIVLLFFLSLKHNARASLFVLPFLSLMIFNDRFLNMNPYPFVMFVIMFAASVRPARRSATEQGELQKGGLGLQRSRTRERPASPPLHGGRVPRLSADARLAET
jgi:O-antigen ligase